LVAGLFTQWKIEKGKLKMGRRRSKDGEKEQNSFLSSLFDFFAFAVFPLL
jgi:hypothetical protein